MLKAFFQLFKVLADFIADFFGGFFKGVARWWGISVAALTVIITATASSISYIKDIFFTICALLETSLGSVTSLNPGDPLSGDFASSVSIINSFIPLTEIFAGIVTILNLWILMWFLRFLFWCIKWIKWLIFIAGAAAATGA
jgi:hypothetical protein